MRWMALTLILGLQMSSLATHAVCSEANLVSIADADLESELGDLLGNQRLIEGKFYAWALEGKKEKFVLYVNPQEELKIVMGAQRIGVKQICSLDGKIVLRLEKLFGNDLRIEVENGEAVTYQNNIEIARVFVGELVVSADQDGRLPVNTAGVTPGQTFVPRFAGRQ